MKLLKPVLLTLLLVYISRTDAGKWKWTDDVCRTVEQKCRCIADASGPTCAEFDVDACYLSVSSKGFDDAGCDADTREDCAVLHFAHETYRPFAQDFVVGVKRGIAVMVFEPANCSIVGGETFDTFERAGRSYAMRDYVRALDVGTVVVVVTADEYTEQLMDVAEELLSDMGSQRGDDYQHRSALSLITRKTSLYSWCPKVSQYTEAGNGPAVGGASAQALTDDTCINGAP